MRECSLQNINFWKLQKSFHFNYFRVNVSLRFGLGISQKSIVGTRVLKIVTRLCIRKISTNSQFNPLCHLKSFDLLSHIYRRYIDTYVISEKAECPIYRHGLSLFVLSSLSLYLIWLWKYRNYNNLYWKHVKLNFVWRFKYPVLRRLNSTKSRGSKSTNDHICKFTRLYLVI